MPAILWPTDRGGKEGNTSPANPDHPLHGGSNWHKLKLLSIYAQVSYDYMDFRTSPYGTTVGNTFGNNFHDAYRNIQWHLQGPIHSSLKKEQIDSNDFWHGNSDFSTFQKARQSNRGSLWSGRTNLSNELVGKNVAFNPHDFTAEQPGSLLLLFSSSSYVSS